MTDQATTAMSVLELNPSTKSQIVSFSKQITDSIEDGHSNPLKILVQCRALEKLAEDVIEKIKTHVLKEADKYQEKSFDFLGNVLEKSEAGVKYNYAATGCPIWEQLDATANSAIERRKEREAFLRTIKAGDITKAVNPETGEEVTLKPCPKTSTSIVKVSLR